MSQRELGERIGLRAEQAQHTITRWERGVSKGPHPELLAQVIEVLGVKPEVLLGGNVTSAEAAPMVEAAP